MKAFIILPKDAETINGKVDFSKFMKIGRYVDKTSLMPELYSNLSDAMNNLNSEDEYVCEVQFLELKEVFEIFTVLRSRKPLPLVLQTRSLAPYGRSLCE